jgi:hypothetical protein
MVLPLELRSKLVKIPSKKLTEAQQWDMLYVQICMAMGELRKLRGCLTWKQYEQQMDILKKIYANFLKSRTGLPLDRTATSFHNRVNKPFCAPMKSTNFKIFAD